MLFQQKLFVCFASPVPAGLVTYNEREEEDHNYS